MKPFTLAITVTVLLALAGAAAANPLMWAAEWPDTDFSKHSVEFAEILSGGPPREGQRS